MNHRFVLNFCRSLLCIAFLIACGNTVAQDWPALRGANGYGSLKTDGILSKTSQVGLKTRWKKRLGSGYSSVVVAEDRAVTMYTDGNHDQIACLDALNGETLWQVQTGPSFKGENGSFDGPLSTPLIHDGNVFALTPTGRLMSVVLSDGELNWSRELTKDESAIKPLYGFVTSPIVVDGTLIVQIGAEKKALAGIDPKSGETKWTATSDRIDSQTPAVINIGGKNIVLAAGGKFVYGVDPVDGKVVMEYEHKGGNGSAVTPVPIGDNKILLTLDDSFSKCISLRPGENGQIQVSEEWQDRSIKNTYNIPAYSGGHVYAYTTRILTCVDPKTGRAVWKNRAPGDGFLITIDGHMIINTKQGGVHIARATSKGYEEIAGQKLFDKLVWSVPAYSDNSVFMRSLGEIARVDIVPTDAVVSTSSETSMPLGSSFKSLLANVAASADDAGRKSIVDEFVKSNGPFPLVEDDIAHFVYRGPQTDVALASDVFGARQERKMTRVDGTDLFYYTLKLPSDQRANYVFLVDYKPQTDPLNPRSTTSSMYAGEMEFAVRLEKEEPLKMSWFGMSDWKEPEFLKDTELAGKLVERAFKSKTLETEIKLEVYLPPSYDAEKKENRFPVIYVFAGPGAKETGKFTEAADQLFQHADAHQIRPAILVLVGGGGPPGPKFMDVVSEEIVPFVDAEFLTIANRESRSVVGFGFTSGSALGLLGAKPDLFSAASVQSPLVFDAAMKSLDDQFGKIDQDTRIYIDWGRFDMYNPHENWDLRDISKELFDSFKKNPKLTVTGGMVNDSTDWSSWRNRFDKVLSVLSPKTE